jgi:hypothetical protein
MRGWLLLGLALVALCASLPAAGFPELRYLDEIGYLGMVQDPRTSVKFGRVTLTSTDVGGVFQGRDDRGKRWKATVPIHAGVAFTSLWQADFDHNLRPDLLIAAFAASNGRCIDRATRTFLMFNDRGQPVPWVIGTRALMALQKPPFPGSLRISITTAGRNWSRRIVSTETLCIRERTGASPVFTRPGMPRGTLFP